MRDPSELPRLELLRLALEVAVPLEIARLRESWELRGLSPEAVWTEIRDAARGAARILAGPAGADVLYRSEREGETASAFAELAQGLACLSFCPGGVTAFGLRFQAAPGLDWFGAGTDESAAVRDRSEP